MHRILAAAIAMSLSLGAFAQEHHGGTSDVDFLKLLATMSRHNAIEPDFSAGPAATVTINMTARSFSFSPNTFTVNRGDNVVINLSVPAGDNQFGHGLLMDTYVNPGKNVLPGQTIQITFTATTPGQFAFGCNVSSCGSGHSNMFGIMTVNQVTNPAPAITSINPTSGSTTGGTTVTITGTNFLTGASVKFGSVFSSNVTVTSSTSITAVTPAASSAGAVAVTVSNPDGQSATFNSFTYTPAGPSVTSVTPNNGPTTGGTSITIAGTLFQSGATVTIGGISLRSVVFVNANTITAVTPLGPANEQATQPQDVVVHNPDGTTAILTKGFTWTIPTLSVSLISPNSGLPAGGGEVIINGAGFTTAFATSVTFGGVAATNVSVLDAVTIRATTPAHAAGTVDVAVKVGGNTATVTGGFIYQTPFGHKRAAKH